METLTPAKRNECLVFAVNGEKFEVPNLDPSTTLLEFLRSRTRFKSVKLGCGEGRHLCSFKYVVLGLIMIKIIKVCFILLFKSFLFRKCKILWELE